MGRHQYDSCPFCSSRKQTQSLTCQKCIGKRRATNTACAYCAKEFYRAPHRKIHSLKRNPETKFYCNKSCKAKAEIRKKRIDVPCNYCGKILERCPSGVESHNFCSRKHYGLWFRRFIGPQAIAWKGGYHKTERTRIRSRIAWRELRRNVLAKFDNACAWCGGKNVSLHLHHLDPWRLGGKDVTENLIPLCPRCHSKQTVLDWETEHGKKWAEAGAHTFKEVRL